MLVSLHYSILKTTDKGIQLAIGGNTVPDSDDEPGDYPLHEWFSLNHFKRVTGAKVIEPGLIGSALFNIYKDKNDNYLLKIYFVEGSIEMPKKSSSRTKR